MSKHELFPVIDAFVRRFEEISGTFEEVVSVLKSIALSQQDLVVQIKQQNLLLDRWARTPK
ncbi:MAG: hypothetical protein WAK96_04170 [Desulfobaccales bacterium]